jgi:hypothetical protein
MSCTCSNAPDELTGNAAEDFARSHLAESWVDATNWRVGYRCAESETWWLRDSPQAHLQGGGPPRLRKVSQAEWQQAESETDAP